MKNKQQSLAKRIMVMTGVTFCVLATGASLLVDSVDKPFATSFIQQYFLNNARVENADTTDNSFDHFFQKSVVQEGRKVRTANQALTVDQVKRKFGRSVSTLETEDRLFGSAPESIDMYEEVRHECEELEMIVDKLEEENARLRAELGMSGDEMNDEWEEDDMGYEEGGYEEDGTYEDDYDEYYEEDYPEEDFDSEYDEVPYEEEAEYEDEGFDDISDDELLELFGELE